MNLPFPEKWTGWRLPGVREIDATYDDMPLAQLPPLTVPDDISWLTPIDPRVIAEIDKNRLPGAKPCAPAFEKSERDSDATPSFWQEQLDAVLAQAAQANVQLPNAFVELFGSHKMQSRILDPTGCYFDLPEQGLTPDPFGLGGHILRFQNDQQCCVMWYLFVPPSGSSIVLSSSETSHAFYLEEHDPKNAAHVTSTIEKTAICAHSFAEYLYRFWMEGALWYKCRYKLPLSASENTYLIQLKQLN